jgi:Flp pilus assembly protein TadD
MLAAQGRAGEAIVHVERAVKIAPQIPELHYLLAEALAGQGRVEEAVAEYRQALALRPGWTQAAERVSALTGATSGRR